MHCPLQTSLRDAAVHQGPSIMKKGVMSVCNEYDECNVMGKIQRPSRVAVHKKPAKRKAALKLRPHENYRGQLNGRNEDLGMGNYPHFSPEPGNGPRGQRERLSLNYFTSTVPTHCNSGQNQRSSGLAGI